MGGLEANIVHIFYGIQGEGIYLGIPQLFIRFARCNLRCMYCDTKEALSVPNVCRVEIDGVERGIKNPISVHKLREIINGFTFSYHSICLTGGEPLLQVDFLYAFLKTLDHQRIYLETNGTIPLGLKKIVDFVDIVAMDLKLPSISGCEDLWESHKDFMRLAVHKELFVKMVVERGMDIDEVTMGISLIKGIDPSIPLVIQPQTNNPPSQEELLAYYRLGISSLVDVRIIPQVHRLSGWR